jgi:hypothetical protein
MPHLVQMNKKYAKKGQPLIGVHRQNASDKAIKKVVDKLKVKFRIVKTGSVPGRTGGIPHLFVFSTEGKLVYSEHPNRADKVIKKELRNAKATEKADSFGLPDRPTKLTEMRRWTNIKGKTMTAALVSIDTDKAKLQLFKDNRIVDYPIADLSEADQKLINDKAPSSSEDER